MNKLSEKDLVKLHEAAIVEMYGPYAHVTPGIAGHGAGGHSEWHHALNVVIDVLVEMEKMGFVNLDEFDFGEKNAHKSRYKRD